MGTIALVVVGTIAATVGYLCALGRRAMRHGLRARLRASDRGHDPWSPLP
jgi:hypothetical protein